MNMMVMVTFMTEFFILGAVERHSCQQQASISCFLTIDRERVRFA
jgi:hypothetical protein